MKHLLLFPAACISFAAGCQNNTETRNNIKVGGACEGCEAIYECPVAFDHLTETDTLPDFYDAGAKLEVSGFIYKRDGKTPAPGVVLYIYHTDQKGVYPTKGNEKGWAKRHGYIRGWVKTDKNGFYKFYTLVPASYPEGRNPKHIHATVKEPGFSEYYIDEFVFDDDPYLSAGERTRNNPRGGNGILRASVKDGMLNASRNIILGLNVPDYPKQ